MAHNFTVNENSSLLSGANGGLLDDSVMLDSGAAEDVLSDQGIERALRPEFPAGASNRVAPLRERQAAFLTEQFDLDFDDSTKAVEIAETFFPPLAMANVAHDAGRLLGEAIVDKSLATGALGSGLLGLAIAPIPGSAKKGISKAAIGMNAIVEGGPSEFNTMLNAVLKSKNIKTGELTKEIIPELDKLVVEALEKVEATGGDIIGAGMAEKSGSQMQAILANFKNAVDDIAGINKTSSQETEIATGVQAAIKKHGSVEAAIESVDPFDDKFGGEIFDTLVDLFNTKNPLKALPTTSKLATGELGPQIPGITADEISDAVIAIADDNTPSGTINAITQDVAEVLENANFDVNKAINAVGGNAFMEDILTKLGSSQAATLAIAASKLPDPSKLTPIINATAANARSLVQDIQKGIHTIDIGDAAKVDKFIERRGFTEDVLKRRSKVVLDEDIQNLFDLKEAVFDGNVNDVMSKITQRDIGRVLKRMPKNSAARKEHIAQLTRMKEAGFELDAWHATRSDLVEELVKSGEFKLEKVGTNYGTKREQAIFLSPSPESAKHFGEVILPLKIRSKNPMIVDMVELRGSPQGFSVDLTEEVIEAARLSGNDVVIIKNIEDNGGLQDQILVLDPKLIRSIFADFKDLDSANIGAGIAGASALPFAMRANNHESEPEG